MFVPDLYMVLWSYEFINRDNLMILGGRLLRIGHQAEKADEWLVIRNNSESLSKQVLVEFFYSKDDA